MQRFCYLCFIFAVVVFVLLFLWESTREKLNALIRGLDISKDQSWKRSGLQRVIIIPSVLLFSKSWKYSVKKKNANSYSKDIKN